jgi:hypothetical protein
MTTVVVDLTRADLLRLVILATIVGQRGIPASVQELAVVLLTATIFVVGAVVAIFVINQVCVLIYSRESNGVLGNHVYTLREDGLLESTKANESLTKWGGATAVVKSSDCLYVQVSPGLFHVMPRRCFESADAYEKFWTGIQPLVPNKSLERMRGR